MSLPEGWREVTLKDIGKWGSGGTPKRTNPKYYDGAIPWLIIRDMNDGYISRAETHITEEGLKNSSAKLIPANTLLIAMYGSIGKLGITKIECATNQAIAFCIIDKNIVNQKFVFYYLLSMRQTLLGEGKGGAQQNISQTILKAFPFPLPPLTEQKQIAQKLDQVLARVERIKMALDNTPDTIKRFRQSVLALAVSGGLSEGKNFDKIPLNKLGSICGGKTPSKSKSEYWTNGIVWWVSAKDMKRFEIDSSLDKITEKAVSEAKMRLIPKNSILMVTRSGILSHTFPVAITKDVITINQDLKAFFVDEKVVDFKFLAYTLRGEGQNILTQCSKDGTTVPSVSTEKLMNYEFNIPSLKEQEKIVNKIETLFALADNLETKVNQAQKRIDRLTQSILAKAFRGEL